FVKGGGLTTGGGLMIGGKTMGGMGGPIDGGWGKTGLGRVGVWPPLPPPPPCPPPPPPPPPW
ncbi:hypothetical protein LINGRAHAP2_LOCUS3516, partial [Linum grandiflorum]